MTAPRNIFEELNAVDVSAYTEKKNGLKYLSWADAWTEICKRYPDANYTVYESANNTPLHTLGDYTGYVKVGVTVQGKEIIEYLAVMDCKNQSMILDKIGSTDVIKSIQRCATKAIARHGLGLHVYRGEDYPGEQSEAPRRTVGPGNPPAKGQDIAKIKAEVIKAKQDPGVKLVIDERLKAWGKKALAELDAEEWSALYDAVSKMKSADNAAKEDAFVTGEDLVKGKEFPPAPEGTAREVPFPEDPMEAMDEITRIRVTNLHAKKALDAAMKAADKQFLGDLDEVQLRSMWDIAQKARRESA